MQIVVYKFANSSLFIDRIEEKHGDGFVLCFPEGIQGKCHFGKYIIKIEKQKCNITVPLSRDAYPVFIEGEDSRVEAEGLIYRDGKLHRQIPEEFSSLFYEIASLKETVGELTKQIQALQNAVFHTVIF